MKTVFAAMHVPTGSKCDSLCFLMVGGVGGENVKKNGVYII